MAEEVVVFEQRVKEKVKAIIGELIPDEIWEDIVKKEIEIFKSSTIKNVVHNELITYFKNKVQEEIIKGGWDNTYIGSGEFIAGELVQKIITENINVIFTQFLASVVSNVTNDIKNNLSRY